MPAPTPGESEPQGGASAAGDDAGGAAEDAAGGGPEFTTAAALALASGGLAVGRGEALPSSKAPESGASGAGREGGPGEAAWEQPPSASAAARRNAVGESCGAKASTPLLRLVYGSSTLARGPTMASSETVAIWVRSNT